MRAGWEARGGGRFPCGVRSHYPPAQIFGDASILPPGRQRLVSSCLFRDAEVRQSWGTFQAGKRGLYFVFRLLFF